MPTSANTTAQDRASWGTRKSWILLHASVVFSCAHNLEELFKLICEKTTQALEATDCQLYMLDDVCDHLVFRACSAIGESAPEQLLRSYSEADLFWHHRAVALGEPVVLVPDDPRLVFREFEHRLLFDGQDRAVLLMPLALKTQPLGLVAVARQRSGTIGFTNEEIELCCLIAHLAALAIQNIHVLEASSNQSREMKLVIDHTADGIVRTDLNRRIVTFNPAAERITGYAANDVLGRTCTEVLRAEGENGESLCADKCPLSQITDSQAEVRPSIEWMTRRDGKKVLVSFHAMPVLGKNGRPAGAVAVLRDVTREEELTRLKSDFISMVSHELRTPLTNIGAIAGLLTTLDLEGAEQKRMLHELDTQCQGLLRLVDEVLEASRLDKGQIEPALEPLALLSLVEQEVNAYRTQYKTHHFEIVAPTHPLLALGDFTYLQVVLGNLIHNAVTYSPAASTITIRVCDDGPDLFVSVEDQGVGIPANQLETIFQRYHRGAGNPSGKVKGFGLGLFIARMLVKAQGGRIWAESGPGCGSRLCFSLKKLERSYEKDPDH